MGFSHSLDEKYYFKLVILPVRNDLKSDNHHLPTCLNMKLRFHHYDYYLHSGLSSLSVMRVSVCFPSLCLKFYLQNSQ
jgi:hypothetical protein